MLETKWIRFVDALNYTILETYKVQDGSRVVSYQEGAALARKLQTLFIECSAKTKIGVKEAFEELVEKVSERELKYILQLTCYVRS